VVRPGGQGSLGVIVAESVGIEAYCTVSGHFNENAVRASINDDDIPAGRTATMAHAE
jgi:hypothetical protein